MRRRLDGQGLADVAPRVVVVTRLIPDAPKSTSCAERLERIHGTDGALILRVPFRDPATGQALRKWVSRFDLWPYVENFTLDVERELRAELGGKPDLIIGNYSDGNLVASLLAHRMFVTQCNIVSAARARCFVCFVCVLCVFCLCFVCVCVWFVCVFVCVCCVCFCVLGGGEKGGRGALCFGLCEMGGRCCGGIRGRCCWFGG